VKQYFFAGGDQSNYVNDWYDTPLNDVLNAAVANKVVFGGTSAGCAILGQFVYSALYGSAVSSAALADPYYRDITFAGQFIPLPFMNNIITDTHFVARDRMGRLVAFVARLRQDGNSSNPIGLGLDEVTNIAVDLKGLGVMFGTGTAYVVQNPKPPTVCMPKTPLTYPGMQLVRLDAKKGDTWNFQTMTGSGVAYGFDVSNGVIVGQPYGP